MAREGLSATTTLLVKEVRGTSEAFGKFVGRRDELRVVGEMLASATRRTASVLTIRGDHGTGKSRLASQLIEAARTGALPFARLVADDRCLVEAHAGRLLVRPAPELAGLIEIHGLGIRRLPYEPLAQLGLVIDLAAADAARLPALEARKTAISGVVLPRLAVAGEADPLVRILAWQGTTPADD